MSQNLLETLLKAKDDENANVRKAAAISLGDQDNSHAKAALVKMLSDKVWQVREEVINSIQKAKITEAAPHLLKILGCDDESQARKAILKWAAAKGEDQAASKAKGGANPLAGGGKKKVEPNPWQIKKAAALAVSSLRPDLAAAPLMEMLKVENPSVRSAALIGLGTIQSLEAIGEAIAMCEDKEWNIRKTAATILGRLKAEQAAPVLIKLLDDDKFSVRTEAVIALNHIKSPEALEPLVNTLANDNNYEVRKTAATALGNLKNEEIAPALFKALEDDNWMVKKAALDSITNLKVVDGIDFMAQMLVDEQEEVRSAAAAGLIMLTKISKTKV